MMRKIVLAWFVGLMAANAQATAPTSFAQCGVCHQVTKGAPNGIGPNLFGVVGRKSGVVTGFHYSTPLKSGKTVWTAATLDKWITSPATFIPGSHMPYAGQADAAKRKEIIAYLKMLK